MIVPHPMACIARTILTHAGTIIRRIGRLHIFLALDEWDAFFIRFYASFLFPGVASLAFDIPHLLSCLSYPHFFLLCLESIIIIIIIIIKG